MPLFGSGKKFDFRSDGLPPERNRFQHLDRVVQTGKAQAREPEMKGNGTTIVILPYPNFDNPNYLQTGAVIPDRQSEDPLDYTPWIFYADGIRRFGKNQITLLFDNPDRSTGFNPVEDQPAVMIRDAVWKAVKSQQLIETPFGTSDSDNWNLLLNGDKDNNKYSVLPMPDRLFMVYAMVYSSNSDNYAESGPPLGAADNDLPVVFVMSKGTGQSLFEALDAVKPGSVPGAPDSLLHSTFTGCKFIHFYDRKKPNCPAKANAENVKLSEGGGFGGVRRSPIAAQIQNQSQKTLAGYGVYVSDTLDGRPTGMTIKRSDVAKFATQKLIPWEQAIRGYTPVECARVIADHSGLPLSMLYWAWKSHPEYYPDTIKHGLKKPVSANFAAPSKPVNSVTQDQDSTFGLNDDQDKHEEEAPWGGPVRGGEPNVDDEGIDQNEQQAAMARFRSHMKNSGNR